MPRQCQVHAGRDWSFGAIRSIVVAAAAGAVLATAPLAAQDIRGVVVEANDSTLVAGAVVVLMHASKDSIYTRIITGDRGTFNLRAPAATPVRLRVLRLGFQPTNAGTFTVAAGQTENVRVKLSEARVLLASFDVASTKRCDVRPDSALLVAQLYEEARKALIASATPMSNTRNQTQFTLYSRAQDARGKLLAPIERSSFAGPSSRPFASLSADSLAKVGYVVEEADGTAYRAPDADVLLADSFLQTHCLQLVDGTGERSASVGIGFKPVDRGSRVEVQGTLWLDRESNELQFLEYQYVGIPDEYTKAGVGGRVEYTQMSAGLWFANKWAIRMPRLAARSNERISGLRGEMGTKVEFSGLQITGGEVQWLKVDNDVLYTNNGASLAGSEPRDLQDLKVTAGTFEVEALAQQAVVARTNIGVDTVFSASSCVAVATEGYTGQVKGKVRYTGQPRADSTTVIAEWKEDFRAANQRDFVWQLRRLETKANANGDYVFCGLPLSRAVSLSAASGARKSRVGMVRLTAKEQRSVMDLSIGDYMTAAIADGGRTRGALIHVTDAFGVPIAFANVTVGGNNRVADKDGRVLLTVAPRDSVRVQIRRMGYTAFDKMIGRDSANGPFRATLAPLVQKLKTVTVNDRVTRSSLELTGFYDRVEEVQRGAYRGEFFTPEDLNARPATTIGQFLVASRFVLMSKSRVASVAFSRSQCPMAILLDGMQLNKIIDITSSPADSVQRYGEGRLDINDLVTMGEVSAIEVYPSAASAPGSISSKVSNGNCGIVAIWTGGRTGR